MIHKKVSLSEAILSCRNNFLVFYPIFDAQLRWKTKTKKMGNSRYI